MTLNVLKLADLCLESRLRFNAPKCQIEDCEGCFPKKYSDSERPTTILYTLTYDCGDYYCDSMHLVGVFESQIAAETAQTTFREQYPEKLKNNPSFCFSVAPVEIGKVYDGN
jgi:hypothetical protein